MTDKELKRLSRAEILEMLIRQVKQTADLRVQLEDAEQKLRDRQIVVERAGSIAEASLELNNVYTASESAVEQYLENIKRFSDQQKDICEQIETDARQKAESILREAEEACAAREKDADAYWSTLSDKLEEFYAEHKGLYELLELGRQNIEKENK